MIVIAGLKDIINRTIKPNTVKSLKTDFTELGIEAWDVIIINSSLSQIGGVDRSMILRLNEWRSIEISIGKIKNLRITCAVRNKIF